MISCLGLGMISRRRPRLCAKKKPIFTLGSQPEGMLFRIGLKVHPARREFRNFSRNRPETTNLNHQYAIRRVFICTILDAG